MSADPKIRAEERVRVPRSSHVRPAACCYESTYLVVASRTSHLKTPSANLLAHRPSVNTAHVSATRYQHALPFRENLSWFVPALTCELTHATFKMVRFHSVSFEKNKKQHGFSPLQTGRKQPSRKYGGRWQRNAGASFVAAAVVAMMPFPEKKRDDFDFLVRI